MLHELYMGKLAPFEMHRVLVKEYERKREKACELEETVMDRLESEEMKRAFIRVLDERTGLMPADCEQRFIQGMRLGAQLVLQLTE